MVGPNPLTWLYSISFKWFGTQATKLHIYTWLSNSTSSSQWVCHSNSKYIICIFNETIFTYMYLFWKLVICIYIIWLYIYIYIARNYYIPIVDRKCSDLLVAICCHTSFPQGNNDAIPAFQILKVQLLARLILNVNWFRSFFPRWCYDAKLLAT